MTTAYAGAPVVIVGAGPVGLTAALLLGRRGIPCLVLERHPAPYPLPRAVHLDGEVVRILQEAGVADGFHTVSRPMPGLRLVDGRLRTMAEFRRATVVGLYGHPEASMFDQPELERLLTEATARQPAITLLRGAVVTAVEHRPGGAAVRYHHDGRVHEIPAAAALGCDGASSTVRTALDVPLRDLGFSEDWLVVDVRAAEPLPMWEGVHQVCDPRRAATFMHLVGERYRWEFRVLDTDRIEDLTTSEGIARLLAPWGDAAGFELVRSAAYTFRARIAERWRDRRVFLLGDAAHQTPPFIGQGLGAGLRDAHNLAWKLDLVLRGKAGDALLDTYQAERALHTRRLIRAAIGIGWALTGGGGRTAALRRALVRGVCRVPGVSGVVLGASSPRLRLRPGTRPPVGLLCPQPRTRDGGWFDDMLGDGFALVTLDPVGTARPGVRIVPVGRDSALGHWLIRMNARAVLVRPDRVVCAVARRASDVSRLLPPAPPPAPTAQGARLNTEQPTLGRRGLLAATGASAAALLAVSACATPLSKPPSQPVSSPSTAGESLIDLHAHFVTDTYVAAAVAAGHRTPDGMPSWPSWNVQAHMAVMDAARIEKSILSLSSPGVHFGDDAAARRLAREVNEFAAEVVRAHPSRFGHFAILPLPDVAGAVEEAAYALDHLGANGVAILSNAAGRYPGDPALDPLLAELNRRAAIVFVHPAAPPNAAAVARGRPLPLIEFLFDSARAAVDLVLSDRLSRFPRIRWIFTHGGGVLPLLTARIDLFASQSSGGRAFDSAAMLAKFWFDSAGTPFPSQLPALADAVGTGRIVYGSDFCFTPPPVVAAQVASIDAARAPVAGRTWRGLTAANARALLGSG